ncbi:high mobility group nucleosome binding domain 1 [Phyllostomus discolor]|uniref:High mobility group nucleosome binding domain 1 n=1 Tax=Phyllostomus discolor TaxID=89673 RepID=A0A834AWK1_9CHIR|nr:high mobility group nucleosome binding domain 1 [Phyllostomus discolor]
MITINSKLILLATHYMIVNLTLQHGAFFRTSLQTKRCKRKGKGEQRENRPKWLTRSLRKTYLRKTEKLKTRRVQPRMKQEKKKPSLINIIYHVLSVVPVSLLVQSRGIFLSTIL